MPCTCFRGDGEVGEHTKVAVPPGRVASSDGGIGTDSSWACKFLEVEVVPEGVGEEETGEGELGAEEAAFVVVVSDEHGDFGGCALRVVGKDDGVINGGPKAAEDGGCPAEGGDGIEDRGVGLISHAREDSCGIRRGVSAFKCLGYIEPCFSSNGFGVRKTPTKHVTGFGDESCSNRI